MKLTSYLFSFFFFFFLLPGVLEEALLDNDVNGPLTDLLLMLMVAIFYLQESEEEEDDPDVSKGKLHTFSQNKKQLSQLCTCGWLNP